MKERFKEGFHLNLTRKDLKKAIGRVGSMLLLAELAALSACAAQADQGEPRIERSTNELTIRYNRFSLTQISPNVIRVSLGYGGFVDYDDALRAVNSKCRIVSMDSLGKSGFGGPPFVVTAEDNCLDAFVAQ